MSPNNNTISAIKTMLKDRSIVMIGMMGAGKLDLPYVDADTEIEEAAGKSIEEIFAEHGEEHFRDGERRVIERLLKDGPQVLATGGGAFMSAATRANIAKRGISIWLKASHAVLMKRVSRRGHRPLLKTKDPAAVLQKLIEERYPVYEQADIIVESRDAPHDTIVMEALERLGALAETC